MPKDEKPNRRLLMPRWTNSERLLPGRTVTLYRRGANGQPLTVSLEKGTIKSLFLDTTGNKHIYIMPDRRELDGSRSWLIFSLDTRRAAGPFRGKPGWYFAYKGEDLSAAT